MVSTQDVLGALAVALGLFGYFFYVRGIVRGTVKPHAFTWFVWALLTTIAFAAQVVDDAGPGAWVTGVTALCSFGFAAVGLGKSSREHIAKSDWYFFAGALAAIPVWLLTGNPLWSVIIITIVDAVAFAPTIRKGYHHPETESVGTYALSGIKFVIGLFALTNITWITTLYPASLVLANLGFVIVLLWRRRVVAASVDA